MSSSWREWVLSYLTQERDQLRSSIELFSSGRCQFVEMRDGKQVDVSAEVAERNKANLAEIEEIIAKAEAMPDDQRADRAKT